MKGRITLSISKRYSHVVYDKIVNKYYFVLPDGSDREIPYINWVENVDWRKIYIELYRLIINKDPRVQELDKMEVREICQLFNIHL